jgi:hypothetical protein
LGGVKVYRTEAWELLRRYVWHFFLSRPYLACPREEFEIGWFEYWNIENWFEKRVSGGEMRPFMKLLMLQRDG